MLLASGWPCLPEPWQRRASVAFYLCLVAVLLLTLTPLSIPDNFPQEDKVHHLLAFGTLAVLAAASWRLPWWQLWLPLSALGALIELIQRYVPNRSCDFWDWFADTLGVILGWVLYPLCRRLFLHLFAARETLKKSA